MPEGYSGTFVRPFLLAYFVLQVSMEFLIDNRVIYRVEDNTLVSNKAPEQKITLTLTASRLLLLLLNRHGDVLPREVIFKHVWEDYGLDGSGNTLTQYISVLRRALHTLGVSGDAILTVPRIGFMVSADLVVICLPSSPQELHTDANVTPPVVPEVENEASAGPYFRRNWYLVVILACIIVSTILILLYVNDMQLERDTYTLSFVPVGEYQGCRVFTLPMYDHDRNRPSPSITTAVIRSSGFNCIPGRTLYVHIDGNVANGERGKIWVSFCEPQKDSGKLQCRDYISNDWIIQQ